MPLDFNDVCLDSRILLSLPCFKKVKASVLDAIRARVVMNVLNFMLMDDDECDV